MSKVKFRIRSAGIKPGDTLFVSDAEAARLVANHHAVYVLDDELELEVDLGTVAAVLERVGDDKALAQAALDAEQAKGDGARVTLVDKLKAVIDGE